MFALLVFLLLQIAHAAELLAVVQNIPSACNIGSSIQFLNENENEIQVVGNQFKMTNIATTVGETTLNNVQVDNIKSQQLIQKKSSTQTHSTFTKQVLFQSIEVTCGANNCIFTGAIHFPIKVNFGGDYGTFERFLERIQKLEDGIN